VENTIKTELFIGMTSLPEGQLSGPDRHGIITIGAKFSLPISM